MVKPTDFPSDINDEVRARHRNRKNAIHIGPFINRLMTRLHGPIVLSSELFTSSTPWRENLPCVLYKIGIDQQGLFSETMLGASKFHTLQFSAAAL